MSEGTKDIAEVTKPELYVTVPHSILELHWQLTNTREWPLSMMMDLAKVKDALQRAIGVAEGELADVVEAKSSD